MVIGVVFYDTDSPYPIFELISKYGTNAVNRLAYNISVDAVWQIFHDDQERKDAYQFCTLSFGPCSVRAAL